MSENRTADAGTTTPKTTKPRAAAKMEALVYMGPNRAYDLPIMKNRIIANGRLPETWQAIVREKPHFGACFVPISSLGVAMKDWKHAGSDLSRAAARVLKETIEIRKAAGGKAS